MKQLPPPAVKNAVEAWAGSISGTIPVAVQAMAEKGIDISANQPKLLESSPVAQADVVITMGCGDARPFCASGGGHSAGAVVPFDVMAFRLLRRAVRWFSLS